MLASGPGAAAPGVARPVAARPCARGPGAAAPGVAAPIRPRPRVTAPRVAGPGVPVPAAAGPGAAVPVAARPRGLRRLQTCHRPGIEGLAEEVLFARHRDPAVDEVLRAARELDRAGSCRPIDRVPLLGSARGLRSE